MGRNQTFTVCRYAAVSPPPRTREMSEQPEMAPGSEPPPQGPRTLLRDRRVGDLALETYRVDARQTCEQVLDFFDSDPRVFVVAVMSGGRLRGLVTRTRLLTVAAGQFGFALNAQKPVGSVASEPATVSFDASVADAAIAALNRPSGATYEPLAVCDGDRFVGVIGLIDLMRALAEDQQTLLQAYAERAAELEQLQRATLYLAEHDSLTSILNRRAWFNRAVELRPSALVLFDVDYFKLINDTYGHPSGDDVLREVAARLQAVFHGRATLGRIGGEEFAGLITVPWAEAVDLCVRATEAMAGRPVALPGGETLSVTLSAGVSRWQGGGATREASLARAYESADAALYEAKRTGRNRVVVAGAPPAVRSA